MNLEQLQNKLLAAARAQPEDARVPYAFEKRVLAHLAPPSPVDLPAFWARALWRAAVPCVAVTVLLAAASFLPSDVSSGSEDLSQQFEQALLASADQLEENW
jgi:hypothetical protein